MKKILTLLGMILASFVLAGAKYDYLLEMGEKTVKSSEWNVSSCPNASGHQLQYFFHRSDSNRSGCDSPNVFSIAIGGER
jgi:hypothetical protein